MATKTKMCDFLIDQAGVIVWTGKPSEPQVLLIQSRGGNGWLTPKGMLEPNMSRREVAALEAWEEAGVKGEVGDRVGSYEYVKNSCKFSVRVYAMKVKSQHNRYPEAGERTRAWHRYDKAARMVKYPGLAKIIRDLPKLLG